MNILKRPILLLAIVLIVTAPAASSFASEYEEREQTNKEYKEELIAQQEKDGYHGNRSLFAFLYEWFSTLNKSYIDSAKLEEHRAKEGKYR